MALMTSTHKPGSPSLEDWLTIEEAILLSGYTGQYLRRMARKGRLLAVKRGHFWLVERASLQAYMEAAGEMQDKRFGPRDNDA